MGTVKTVRVRRSLRGEATVLPLATLPEVPPDVSHTWRTDLAVLDEAADFMVFGVGFGDADAVRSLVEVNEAHASVAHRLAALDGYTGDLDIWILPLVQMTFDYAAMPSQTAAAHG